MIRLLSTKAGLDAARQKGRVGGRKRVMTNEKIAAAKRLLRDGMDYRNVASTLGVSHQTLYN